MSKDFETKTISWSGHDGWTQTGIVLNTGVPAIDKATAGLLDKLAKFQEASREQRAARSALDGAKDAARRAATLAGLEGKKPDKKKLKAAKLEAADRLEDAELDFIALETTLRKTRVRYLEVLADHAPALATQARNVADAAILELASALGIARRGEAKVTAALGILGALPTVLGGDGFKPWHARIKKTPADDFNDSGNPGIHASQAVDELTQAVGYAKRILDELAAVEKERAKAAKLETEADAAPDLDDDDDDDDI
ncbi:hypothetical protein [Microbacterium sp. Leaf179]|uniref:hypothetical protein n=1 Tax=Microbacterium sp. Leaf179 TaxID=1736288 RepID=UPI0006F95B9F|nr:hypothetical protein [Microbacterium sp. Leaf179]KQR86513.1 hypothetical protein ASF96_09110 [Microbacterium sp. Leaf179]